MAFKDASGAFRLERSEENQALTEMVYGEGVPHAQTWDQFDKEYQARITQDFLRKHPELRPDSTDPVGPKSGLTQRQLTWIADKISEALVEMLPEMVKAPVAEALTIGFDLDATDVDRIATRVSDRLPGVREIAELKREIGEVKRANGGTARGGEIDERVKGSFATVADTIEKLDAKLTRLAASVESQTHRLDRHQSHLANLESKTKSHA